jgi:hypothetical protein
MKERRVRARVQATANVACVSASQWPEISRYSFQTCVRSSAVCCHAWLRTGGGECRARAAQMSERA